MKIFAVAVALSLCAGSGLSRAQPPAGKAPAAPAAKIAPQPAKDTRLAEFTRDRYLRVKVTAAFDKEIPLRDLLKDFAGQVLMQGEFDHPVMWTYADRKLGSLMIAYTCTDKPLDSALDEICTKLKLGYFVISQEDHVRDGWVRVTASSERGFGSLTGKPMAKPAAEPAPKIDNGEEIKASARLTAAKELLAKGRKATARAVLNSLLKKYPMSKSAAEAKTLLEKLDK